MARRRTERKPIICAECGKETVGGFASGFEITCMGECARKNDAKWRALSDEEFKQKQEELRQRQRA